MTSEIQEKLRNLMRSASGVLVGAVTQDPFCLESSETDSIGSQVEVASSKGYEWLPIREAGGIDKVVRTERLIGITSWDDALRQSERLRTCDIISRHAPLLSLLHRLERVRPRDMLFVLGQHGIDGIVTVFDLNQPASHLFGLGLAFTVEAAIGTALLDSISATSVAGVREALLIASDAAGVRPPPRLVSLGNSASFLDAISCLTFEEKLEIVRVRGMDRFVAMCGGRYIPTGADIRGDLFEVRDFRNDVAHQLPGLDDYPRTHRRMLIAYKLAHALFPGE